MYSLSSWIQQLRMLGEVEGKGLQKMTGLMLSH